MAQTTTEREQQPVELSNGLYVCPCGALLLVTGCTGSMDDTASATTYECSAGHGWTYAFYGAWPSASGWYRRA